MTTFAHANIIGYTGRPFKDAQEMDECLIERWNEKVKPSDHIYNLGDLCMCRPGLLYHSVFKRLNGHKRLVRGNHDIYKTKEYIDVGFKEIYGVRVLDDILFTHIPIHPESLGRFRANVHGHIHEKPNYPSVARLNKDGSRRVVPYLNISVEQTQYAPVSLDELNQMIRKAQQ